MGLSSPHKEKDPQSKEWFYVDWVDWLEAGDSVANATWALTGGLSKDLEKITGAKTYVKLSGGNVGDALATVHMTTTNGEENDQTLFIRVRLK